VNNKEEQRLKEVTLCILVGMALFYFIALVSFQLTDDAWRHQGESRVILNACGVVGAWLADISLTFLGIITFSFPFLFFRHALLCIFTEDIKDSFTGFCLRFLGFMCLLLSLSIFCYLYILEFIIELPYSTGGILGASLGDFLVRSFGNSGATLSVLLTFFIGITLYERISWKNVVDFLGKSLLNGLETLMVKINTGRKSRGRAEAPSQKIFDEPRLGKDDWKDD